MLAQIGQEVFEQRTAFLPPGFEVVNLLFMGLGLVGVAKVVFHGEHGGKIACQFQGLSIGPPVPRSGMQFREFSMDDALAGSAYGGAGLAARGVFVDVFLGVAGSFRPAKPLLGAQAVDAVHALAFAPVGIALHALGQVEVVLDVSMERPAFTMEGMGIADRLVGVVKPDDGDVSHQAGGNGLALPLGVGATDDAFDAVEGERTGWAVFRADDESVLVAADVLRAQADEVERFAREAKIGGCGAYAHDTTLGSSVIKGVVIRTL